MLRVTWGGSKILKPFTVSFRLAPRVSPRIHRPAKSNPDAPSDFRFAREDLAKRQADFPHKKLTQY